MLKTMVTTMSEMVAMPTTIVVRTTVLLILRISMANTWPVFIIVAVVVLVVVMVVFVIVAVIVVVTDVVIVWHGCWRMAGAGRPAGCEGHPSLLTLGLIVIPAVELVMLVLSEL